MKKFDAKKAWAHIKELDYPRLVNTAGEDRARDELFAKFKALGYETWFHAFKYSTGGMTKFSPAAMASLALLLGLCVWTYWLRTPLLLAPAVLLWIVFLTLLRLSESDSVLTMFAPKNVGFNIIGRKPSARGRSRVLVMAHYDTKSQIMPVHIRVALYVTGLVLLIVLQVLYLASAIILMVKHGGGPASAVLMGVSFFAIVILVILAVNPPLNSSVGAMDDASGVAIILELGRCLGDEELRNVDVWLVATDCEEVGLLGALYMAREHKHELPLDNTWLINLDMPLNAAGEVSLNTSHGLPPKPTCRKLNRMIADIAHERSITLRHLPIPIGAAADHFPFLRAGYEATAFIAASTVVHTSRDTADRVPIQPLAHVGEICLELILRLDAELG